MNKLDTRPWNLGLPVGLVLVAACGRTLPLLPSEEESETDTEDPSGVTIDPTVHPDPTVDPDECRTSEDCPPGYYCGESNQCIEYYDYCDEGDCCWDGCCYDGCHYYECYSDYDCGDGYECRYYECVPADNEPGYCKDIPIGFVDATGILDHGGEVSLAFVDIPGDGHELAIATGGVVQIVGIESSALLSESLDAESIAAGDVDGDGDEDIVVLAQASLHSFIADAQGAFVAGPVTDVAIASEARLVLADSDGNGVADAFVGRNGSLERYAGVGDGSFAEPGFIASLWCGVTSEPSTFAPPADDLYYGGGGQLWWLPGNPDAGLEPYEFGGKLAGDVCSVDAGDFDGDGLVDVATLDTIGGGAVTTYWALAKSGGYVSWYPPYVHSTMSMADLDADGREDLVLAGPGNEATIRFGSAEFDNSGQPLGCYMTTSLGVVAEQLLVGDFDGSGRPDLVVVDESSVWLVISG